VLAFIAWSDVVPNAHEEELEDQMSMSRVTMIVDVFHHYDVVVEVIVIVELHNRVRV